MTKEKQIEEMARNLEEHTCMSQFQAEIASRMLYQLDYRKASDVAEEIFAEIEVVLNIMFEEHAMLGHTDYNAVVKAIWRKLCVELKKKYTEGKK